MLLHYSINRVNPTYTHTHIQMTVTPLTDRQLPFSHTYTHTQLVQWRDTHRGMLDRDIGTDRFRLIYQTKEATANVK